MVYTLPPGGSILTPKGNPAFGDHINFSYEGENYSWLVYLVLPTLVEARSKVGEAIVFSLIAPQEWKLDEIIL